jgi:FkbM family methyltransferase
MPFVSYAQNYEDVILWRALRDVEKGFYVDIGAADPEEWSITRAFYDRGWSGINVEPLDEYFDKLKQARLRDTNLKVAVGREAGVRTFHTIAGTGLSTFDPQIAARHQAAGWQASKVYVPVLTLTKIFDDCASPVVHFLKIDVEGAESEVLEGLNLDLVRPWIILIEATEPFSTVSTRDKWEHRITGHAYSFAYFDGLNCFYVADEVTELKERLAVPPNVFDDFVRWPETSSREKAVALQQEVEALQAEKTQTVNLRHALQVEKAQTVNLRHALQVEKAQTVNLQNALEAKNNTLRAEQAQINYLLGGIRQLEAELAVPSVDRAIGRVLRRLHDTCNRLTGGGARALVKRTLKASLRLAMGNPGLMALGRGALKPFPKVTTILYQLATTQDAVAASPVPPPVEPRSSDSAATFATLPASARSAYLKLQAAMADGNAWRRIE